MLMNLPAFETESFDRLPERRRWDHAIGPKPGSDTFNSNIYPLPTPYLNPIEQAELDKFLEGYLKSGQICPSKSPVASPYSFVKNQDGSICPVQDYHNVNDITIKNRYLLALFSEGVHKLRGARIFTKPDVRWIITTFVSERDEWNKILQRH